MTTDEAVKRQAEHECLIEELTQTLKGIAEADPRTWDPEMRDQFQQWAQSRARAALARAKEQHQ
ncbi:hypothetical protein [Cupriavidus gilardii]|uniref:Uncharacterized protein n=1 Tax=Cupriavidus gilardii TaxID=82541 RepID=A0A849BID2_9BURK|nr:hypothetical protein [Cupriavidus gilardii]KAB0597761.1 hypothetical protein F7Q96_07520 [Cupriavidus gilardii]NNH14066.1 hypothetical protein [Cupriavidus gilardii]